MVSQSKATTIYIFWSVHPFFAKVSHKDLPDSTRIFAQAGGCQLSVTWNDKVKSKEQDCVVQNGWNTVEQLGPTRQPSGTLQKCEWKQFATQPACDAEVLRMVPGLRIQKFHIVPEQPHILPVQEACSKGCPCFSHIRSKLICCFHTCIFTCALLLLL